MARTGGAVAQSANNLPTTGPVEDTLSMVIGLTAILGAGYFTTTLAVAASFD